MYKMYYPYKRRGYRRKVGYKKKPVYRKARRQSVAKLARRVTKLSNRISKTQEVKEYTPVDIFANTVGQVDVNSSGTRIFQLNAMNIPAGVNDGERIGIQAKMIGMSIRFQFTQQSQAEPYNKFIIDVWKTNEFSYSDSGLRDVLYDTDSISGVVDANSTRNMEFIKSKTNPSGMFELLKTKVVTLKEDQVSGHMTFKDCKIFIKQQQLLSWGGPSTNVPINCRYFIAIRAQIGNRNPTTPSTLTTVPVLVTNSGALVRFQHTDYYVDA